MDRGFWITTFLFMHVLGAVTSVGPALTYAMWIGRSETAGAPQRAFALRTIAWIDGRLATPSFVMQAVTGVALILLLEIDFFQEAWLLTSVGIYVAMTVVAVGFFAPAFRRQTALAERIESEPAGDALAADYRRAAAAARAFGIVAVVATLLILFLMVVKPALWSAG